MHWTVKMVVPVTSNSLDVAFADGMRGRVQFESSHLTGVFSALKNPDLFKQVFIQGGAVAWPNDLDLAPDAMYHAIKASGVWVLR
jgi:Protein of unknown function (DUF2442)